MIMMIVQLMIAVNTLVANTLLSIVTIITLVLPSHARMEVVNTKMLFAMIMMLVLTTTVSVNLVVYPGLKTVMTMTLALKTAAITIVDANIKM
jgi:hypothetical protein